MAKIFGKDSWFRDNVVNPTGGFLGETVGTFTGQRGRRERERARRDQDAAVAAFEELHGYLPDQSELEDFQTLQDSDRFYGPPSQAGQAAGDIRGTQAVTQALDQLGGWSRGELTDADRQAMELIRMREAEANRGMQGAIRQDLQSRGLGGSGVEAMQRMQAQQNASQNMAMQNAALAGMVQQRALQATGQLGRMGGQWQGQTFDQNYRRGQAVDDYNRYNTDWRRNLALGNLGIQNQNIAQGNFAGQADFNNRLALAQGIAGARTGRAGFHERSGQGYDARQGAMWGAALNAAAPGAGSGFSSQGGGGQPQGQQTSQNYQGGGWGGI